MRDRPDRTAVLRKATFPVLFIVGKEDAAVPLATALEQVTLPPVSTALFLERPTASDEDIRVYVSSPGGHVESGDAIHDMIKFIKPKVIIIGTGWVASAGALIYVSVPKERRICLPNTRFLLHQPSGGTRGMASDIEIQANEIIKMNKRLIKIFAKATGQSEEKVAKDIDRDYWLSAEEAKEYGLVGKIAEKQSEL